MWTRGLAAIGVLALIAVVFRYGRSREPDTDANGDLVLRCAAGPTLLFWFGGIGMAIAFVCVPNPDHSLVPLVVGVPFVTLTLAVAVDCTLTRYVLRADGIKKYRPWGKPIDFAWEDVRCWRHGPAGVSFVHRGGQEFLVHGLVARGDIIVAHAEENGVHRGC